MVGAVRAMLGGAGQFLSPSRRKMPAFLARRGMQQGFDAHAPTGHFRSHVRYFDIYAQFSKIVTDRLSAAPTMP